MALIHLFLAAEEILPPKFTYPYCYLPTSISITRAPCNYIILVKNSPDSFLIASSYCVLIPSAKYEYKLLVLRRRHHVEFGSSYSTVCRLVCCCARCSRGRRWIPPASSPKTTWEKLEISIQPFHRKSTLHFKNVKMPNRAWKEQRERQTVVASKAPWHAHKSCFWPGLSSASPRSACCCCCWLVLMQSRASRGDGVWYPRWRAIKHLSTLSKQFKQTKEVSSAPLAPRLSHPSASYPNSVSSPGRPLSILLVASLKQISWQKLQVISSLDGKYEFPFSLTSELSFFDTNRRGKKWDDLKRVSRVAISDRRGVGRTPLTANVRSQGAKSGMGRIWKV